MPGSDVEYPSSNVSTLSVGYDFGIKASYILPVPSKSDNSIVEKSMPAYLTKPIIISALTDRQATMDAYATTVSKQNAEIKPTTTDRVNGECIVSLLTQSDSNISAKPAGVSGSFVAETMYDSDEIADEAAMETSPDPLQNTIVENSMSPMNFRHLYVKKLPPKRILSPLSPPKINTNADTPMTRIITNGTHTHTHTHTPQNSTQNVPHVHKSAPSSPPTHTNATTAEESRAHTPPKFAPKVLSNALQKINNDMTNAKLSGIPRQQNTEQHQISTSNNTTEMEKATMTVKRSLLPSLTHETPSPTFTRTQITPEEASTYNKNKIQNWLSSVPPLLPQELIIPGPTACSTSWQSPKKRRCNAMDEPVAEPTVIGQTIATPIFKSGFAIQLHQESRRQQLNEQTQREPEKKKQRNENQQRNSQEQTIQQKTQLQQAQENNEQLPQQAQQQHVPQILINNIESKKIPPIFLQVVPEIMPLLEKLKKNHAVGKFKTKATFGSGLRILCDDMATYHAIQIALTEDNVHIHTHQLRSNKGFHVILRYLHHSTPRLWLQNELNKLGFKTRSVRLMKHRFTGNPLNLFEIELEPQVDGSHEDVLKLKELDRQSVVVERQAKPRDPAQCHRCQNYGHTKNYCRRPFKCMKCAGEHPSTACTKPRATDPKCANCGGKHISCYKGCPAFKEARSKLNANRVNSKEQRHQQIHQQRQPLRFDSHQQQKSQSHHAAAYSNHSAANPQMSQESNAKMSFSQVVRGGVKVVHTRNPAESHLTNLQLKLRQEQCKQNITPGPEKQQPTQSRTTTPKRPLQPSHNRVVRDSGNPATRRHYSIQRHQLKFHQNSRQVHQQRSATKKSTTTISASPKQAADNKVMRDGRNSERVRNPAEKHLASLQQQLREEQQQLQLQVGQQSISNSTLSQALEQNMAMFTRMEKRIDSLFNIFMQFISSQISNKNNNINNSPTSWYQQDSAANQNYVCPMDLEFPTANEITNNE